jgi:two-component system, OmpR family, phosphate regulon sensor histidine kinase PhoR
MNSFLPRMLFAALMAAIGAVAGSAIGWGSDAVLAMTVLGAAVGASASAFIDRMRGYRLMKWLRSDLSQPAPRDAAFWGELAYRVEKALHLRQREIESERAQNREFLAAIEASPNGVLLLDRLDQIEWCNSVAADHLGLDRERDLRQRITNLVRDPSFVAYLQEGRFEQPVSFDARRKQGTVSVLVRPYGNGKKLLLSLDITERERTEAMRRDFVANVSHEIRTPLTVLAGFVETMASLPLTEVERKRVLALMEQQTTRMQALVSDLLTLAQLEGSPRPAPDRWVPVHQLVEHALAEARPLSGGRHEIAALHLDGAELAGSSTELQSALSNLVTNAVRYTPAGGRIEVRWVSRPDGSGCFEVSDTGPGIAREHLSRLTERFYRVDGGRSRESGGTGLGLSIVKHVMQRHAGEIQIESEPGKGATFRLVFPSSRVRQVSAAVDAPVD